MWRAHSFLDAWGGKLFLLKRSKRRDEQRTVPGGNVSSGRNLALTRECIFPRNVQIVLGLYALDLREVPGESRRGTQGVRAPRYMRKELWIVRDY
jgi:hypothetical protein